jgi:DNA helicase II / ATP-dependent DNA helicase PcrA
MVDVLAGLNAGQKEAVLETGRHVLVVAGPGTGKTFTIVRRIAHLLDLGIAPSDILAVTFTNRAAREMRERLFALLGSAAEGAFIGTFHLLGLRILRESGMAFSICSREEQIRVLQSISGCSQNAAREMAGSISRSKNLVESAYGEEVAMIDAYQEALKKAGLCDFDDLISLPVHMIREGGAAPRFSHIIVDEYQDISPAQYQLLRCLVNETTKVCAVGDSDQAIYGFRGADLRNFFDFRRDFPDAATVVLRENYRSTQVIVDAAGAVVRNNQQRIEKELNAVGQKGRPVTIVSVPDEKAEAEVVVREIETRLGGTSHYRLAELSDPVDFSDSTYSFSDFAVLFRTNGQAKAFREAFAAWGMPCQLVGEKASQQRQTLIDDLRAQKGALTPDLGIDHIVERTGAEGRLSEGDRALLVNLAAAYRRLPADEALSCMIDELSLLGTADAFDPRADAVVLTTMHMAKGLEFRVVFLAGAETGVIPLDLGHEDGDVEEERRLFYVAMTRAKEELFVVHAKRRFLYGRRLPGLPTPFLSEIPQGLIKKSAIADRSRKKEGKQLDLFG